MAEHAIAAQEELNNPEPAETSPISSTRVDESPSESPNRVASKAKNAARTSAPGSGAEAVADKAEDYDAEAGDDVDDVSKDAAPVKRPMSPVRLAMVLGMVMVVVLGMLAGWQGFREYQSHQAQQQHELFVRVGRQGALNLTTIDWQHAEADVQRILDSATGSFHDDFSQRSKPFVDVVKKAQSKSTGTVTEAGLESQSGDEAQVLVTVSVNTSNLGAAEQDPRHWRMRITVQKIGNEAKVSNVAFVP